jgi:hypothetical protein
MNTFPKTVHITAGLIKTQQLSGGTINPIIKK